MMKIWPFTRKGASGFSAASDAKQVTHGVDANGLTAIVTGATNGIGAETTRTLVLRGVYVVMAVRNVNAGKNLKQKILEENPAANIDVMELDLSSLASVEKFANEFKASALPLNILINNAGIMGIPYQLSKDKIELHFATNYLGHFYLTYLLLDIMKKTVLESKKEGRIVNVTSEAHRLTYSEGIRFERINDKSGYISFQAYGQSKLANILHANELARRMKEEGVSITANSVHPGNVTTNILHHRSFLNGVMHGTIGKLLLKDVEQGAATSCYVALHPQVEGVTGKYFMNSNIARPSYQAEDFVLARQLWDFSLKLTQA